MIKTTIKAITFSVVMAASAIVMPASLSVISHAQAAEWYEGGTLHKGNGLDWQKATYENKLATSGDFIANVYSKKMFIPEIQGALVSTDRMKFMAEKLVEQLDVFFEPDADAQQNKRLFTNQEVGSSAALSMALAGWLKH